MCTKGIDKNNKLSTSFTITVTSLCWYCPHLTECTKLIESNYYPVKVPRHWHLFHHRNTDGGISAACDVYVKIFEDLQELIDKPYERDREIIERESRLHEY